MMSVKSALWKYLDNLPQCEISSWQLYDAMFALTGRHTLPSTLLSYAREYADQSGCDITCIDNQRSIYRYTPGYKISGAITGGKE